MDVDTSKNSKKVRGKKTDNDVALKETVDVDDGVHVKKHNIMLVFPFVTGIAIETATCHLKLCHSFYDYKDEAYEQLTDVPTVALVNRIGGGFSGGDNRLLSCYPSCSLSSNFLTGGGDSVKRFCLQCRPLV